VLVAGCGEAADARPGTVRVVATTGMVADLARVIGGDEVEVTALMGPGVDPHVYKASALDLDRLRSAQIILYNGLGLEGRMGDLFKKLARKQAVVAVT
jgi:manganese/zinc/iron transport system substrate-binding protein